MHKIIDIYNPNCYSLYTDDVRDKDCLKRVFKTYDYFNDDYLNIYVCAEYYRLTYNKHSQYGNFHVHYYNIDKVLDDCIGKYIPFWVNRDKYSYNETRKSESFENITIHLEHLDRPFRRSNVNILDIFKVITENKNMPFIRLKEITTDALYKYMTKGEVLKKDYKVRNLISDALGIQMSSKGNKTWISWSAKGIDENAFLDLVVLLTNKYTTE
jgi:hypothetical protein